MLIVHVQARVKPDCVNEFVRATLDNARQSVLEPGVVRFDVAQQADDPTRFVLVEIYRDDAAPAAHRETAHYKKWRELVEPMMAEPRSRATYRNIFMKDAQTA